MLDIANLKLWVDLNTFGTGIEPLFERMKMLSKKVSSVACAVEKLRGTTLESQGEWKTLQIILQAFGSLETIPRCTKSADMVAQITSDRLIGKAHRACQRTIDTWEKTACAWKILTDSCIAAIEEQVKT
jgi:hypothetical protein